jgi:hypothetical protein
MVDRDFHDLTSNSEGKHDNEDAMDAGNAVAEPTKSSTQKAVIGAVLAGGLLAATTASATGQGEPTSTAKPLSERTPAVAALFTPNSLYAATSGRPHVVPSANGSFAISGGPMAAVSTAPRGDAVVSTGGAATVSIETFFAPTIFANPAAPRASLAHPSSTLQRQWIA